MIEAARRSRNAARLLECHPGFRAPLAQLIKALERESWRPRIQDAWRDPVAQRKAYESGRSDLLWGMHNATSPTGVKESLAVDLLDDDAPLAPRTRYVQRLNELVRRFGLVTGILWSGRKGTKLTQVEKARIVNACSTGDWSEVGRIGYDPLHVQFGGLTVQQAMSGARPPAREG